LSRRCLSTKDVRKERLGPGECVSVLSISESKEQAMTSEV